ncbi:MAG: prepilin-type N-terminal cleavage/methylation domain-containing protein [Acidobacteriota bacterium]
MSKNRNYKSTQAGFSLIELIIVLLVVCILSVLTLMAFKGEKKFLADSEAYLILDVFNEARQRALTQHETMRVEINKTTNTIRLIAENNPGVATDDQIVRTLILEHPNYVVTDQAPTNIANSPTEGSPVPALSFTASVHPLSASQQVATLRFLRNGKVVNAGSNEIGSNAALTGATIFVWMPNYSDSGAPLATGSVIRAITVLGSTASTKYWRCEVEEGECITWKQ